jgi:hypothetical protein
MKVLVMFSVKEPVKIVSGFSMKNQNTYVMQASLAKFPL